LARNLEVFDGGAQIAYAYVNDFYDGSLGVRVRSVINPSPQVSEMTQTGVLAYLNPFTTSAYGVGVSWTRPAAGQPRRVIEINKSSFGGIQFRWCGRSAPGATDQPGAAKEVAPAALEAYKQRAEQLAATIDAFGLLDDRRYLEDLKPTVAAEDARAIDARLAALAASPGN
jgi:hypothetical protein